jgi:GTPase Era involved in 16S rRNA processing
VLHNKALYIVGRDARRVREVHREAIASIKQLGIEAVHVDVFLVEGRAWSEAAIVARDILVTS